jgi:hypothetical protein
MVDCYIKTSEIKDVHFFVHEDESKAKSRRGMYQRNLRLSPYGGDAYVEQYLAQAQRTAHLAGWPRKTWGARVIAALEGKARRIITEDHLRSGHVAIVRKGSQTAHGQFWLRGVTRCVSDEVDAPKTP